MTESVTLRDMDRGSRSTGRRGFSPEIKSVCFRSFHVVVVVVVRRIVWRDGSGYVSSSLVAEVGVVDQRRGATEQAAILVMVCIHFVLSVSCRRANGPNRAILRRSIARVHSR